jgi:hypothetical protein
MYIVNMKGLDRVSSNSLAVLLAQYAAITITIKTYLVDANDLTVNLLDLLQLAHEVPEAGLGNDLVGGKEAHAEKLGGSILLGGEMATDQLVLVKLLVVQ